MKPIASIQLNKRSSDGYGTMRAVRRVGGKFNSRNSDEAFTMIELLVVLVVVCLIVLIALPAMARTKNNSSAAQCMNNLKQLIVAWSGYNGDNARRIVTGYPTRTFSTDKVIPDGGAASGSCWAPGYVGRGHTGGATVQNSFYGTAPYYDRSSAVALQNGAFWPYLKSLEVFKCPSDRDFIRGLNRYADRSYSMNSWMNGITRTADGGGYGLDDVQGNQRFQFFTREIQMRRPSKLFVFVEEDSLFIDDAMFVISMGVLNSRPFLNYPSRMHGPSWNWNFADGHVAQQRMTEAATLVGNNSNSSSKDWQVITNATTEPRNGP